MRKLTRILPRVGPEKFKTYQLLAPVATHHRSATCAETDCAAMANGWRTAVDERTELGAAQAHYIRRESGRKFAENHSKDGLTVFTFEPGQRCFAEHTVPLERPPLFLVKDGDFRGNPRGTRPRRHAKAADWVEDFAEHQDKIARVIDRG